MYAQDEVFLPEVRVSNQSTLGRWRRDLFSFMQWLSRALMLCASLLFAPITTVLGLSFMLISWGRGRFKSFNVFIKDHVSTAIALLVLEVGLLHWLFPVTNIVATSALGFLGTPLVWIIFASSAALLLAVVLGALIMSAYSRHHDPLSQPKSHPPKEKAGLFKRISLPLITFLFAPISTVIGLLISFIFKRHSSFADLIKDNPFIAFSFVALEMGLLHWLLPFTNFIFTLTASAIGTVLTPILWVLFSLAALFILYSLYKSFSAAKSSVSPDQTLNSSRAHDSSRSQQLQPPQQGPHYMPIAAAVDQPAQEQQGFFHSMSVMLWGQQ